MSIKIINIFRELFKKTEPGMVKPEARPQFAFKDLMIHWILQFTLRIAFRCVLHRSENQEVHRWKIWIYIHKTNKYLLEVIHIKVLIKKTLRNEPNHLGPICCITKIFQIVSVIKYFVWLWYTNFKLDFTSRIVSNVNDPSAGSPTETLLRLLLPLND